MSCGLDQTRSNDQIEIDEGKWVRSINGTEINYPKSEELDWKPINNNQINKQWIQNALINKHPSLKSNNIIVHRITTISHYALICGGYYPPIRGGDISFVIDTNNNEYVGHFFDHSSR